jgi:predicted RNase H-like HicB family nuclease
VIDAVERRRRIDETSIFAESAAASARGDGGRLVSGTKANLDQFDVSVRAGNGLYVAAIPDVSLYARGATREEALASLEGRLETLQEDLETFDGLAAEETEQALRLPPPAMRSPAMPRGQDSAGTRDLRAFAIKAVVVFVLFVAGIMFLSAQIQNTVESAGVSLTTSLREGTKGMGGKAFWGKIQKEINRAADPESGPPEDQMRQLVQSVHVLVERWRPLVLEVSRIFEEEPQGTAGAAPSEPSPTAPIPPPAASATSSPAQ